MVKQKVKDARLTWRDVLKDAQTERDIAKRRVRRLTSAIRLINKQLAAGIDLDSRVVDKLKRA